MIRTTFLLVGITFVACSLETEHAACPCLEGYICCGRTNRCIRPDEICEPVPRKWSTMVAGTSMHLNGVWGASSKDIHAAGAEGTLLHYDGSGWSPMACPTTNQMLSLWGTSRSEVADHWLPS